MGAKKLKTGSLSMKFRPPMENSKSSFKGTKPLAEQSTVRHILLMMVVQLCRKVIYAFDISHKIGVYVVGTLLLSVVTDFSKPVEDEDLAYMSRPDNFINQYFVKFAWGWTLLFVGPFVALTSYTVGCGSAKFVKRNLARLVIGTLVWYGITTLFLLIENRSGICNVTKFLSKERCLANGFRWKGFDISGHSFLLIWNNLFIIEEGKAYIGWEKIKEIIRREEHNRSSTDLPSNNNPDSSSKNDDTVLKKLKIDEFLHLRKWYKEYTPYVRALFCGCAILLLLWDVMLICTALYFHIMIEKVLGAVVAVLVWFLLYRFVYTKPWSPASLPGESGPFKYVNFKVKQNPLQQKRDTARSRTHSVEKNWPSQDKIPKFMGMPLYNYGRDIPPKSDSSELNCDHELGDRRRNSIDSAAIQRPLSNARRSRSVSKSRLITTSKNSLNIKYL